MKSLPIEDFSPTLIASVTVNEMSATSTFADEDIIARAKSVAARAAQTDWGQNIDPARLATWLAQIMRERPRTVTSTLTSNASLFDRIKLLRTLPDQITESHFGDGTNATITSKSDFDIIKAVRRNPKTKAVIVNKQPHKAVIKFGSFQFPSDCARLAHEFEAILEMNNVKCFVDHSTDHSTVILFPDDHSVQAAWNQASEAHSKMGYEHQPFSQGKVCRNLSPAAWAVISGISPHYGAEFYLRTNNATSKAREGTAQLRRLRTAWRNASSARAYWRNPDGVVILSTADDLAIKWTLPADVRQEVIDYIETAGANRTRPVGAYLDACIKQVRMLSPTEAEKIKPTSLAA